VTPSSGGSQTFEIYQIIEKKVGITAQRTWKVPDASGVVIFLAWTYSSFIKHPEYEYEVENHRREDIELFEFGSLFPSRLCSSSSSNELNDLPLSYS
jgi:hypothetical protein